MITFSKLIRIAPFDEETRKDILSREASLTEDQKRQITDDAWDLITAEQQANKDVKLDDEIEKLRAGNIPFTDEVNASVESQIDMEFKKKLEGAETDAQIEQVQEELKSHE